MRRIKSMFKRVASVQKNEAQTQPPSIYTEYGNVKLQPLFPERLTPVMADSSRVDYYKKQYNFMDYHIRFFNELTSKIDFRGKSVLEIGGSNTPVELAFGEMKVNKWVCVDKPWRSNLKDQHNHYSKIPFCKFKETKLENALADNNYVIYDEFADYMPTDFYDKFDICVSNCCFEHIDNLPLVLKKIFHSLKNGGILYSKFAPIWSAPNGNHIRINDTELSFSLWHTNNYPKELYHAHLYMGYKEIYQYLGNKYGDDVAEKYTHKIKNGDSLNKLMYEDYLFLMQTSLFSNKSVTPTYIHPIDEKSLLRLRAMYPGYYRFEAAGVNIQAKK